MEPKTYYNREEAAKYLGLGISTLAAWASNGSQDLPYSKMGRMVRYRKEDLDAFMAKGIKKSNLGEHLHAGQVRVSPKPDVTDVTDVTILSDAILRIRRLIEEHNKLDACNSLLTPYNVEKSAQVMQGCLRHLLAVIKGDETTAEIWAHKIKLLTIAR